MSRCNQYAVTRLEFLEMNLKYRANCVNISRKRMAVVLPQVIRLEREVLIYLLDYSHGHAVANPGRGDRVIENFVGDETTQPAKTQLMFKLHSISILGEIWRRRMKVKLDAISINKDQLAERKPDGRFQVDSLFSAVIEFGWLRGYM